MTARELIDRMVLHHDRTSCSDDNRANGYANDQGHYRCARCVLLDGLEHGGFPERVKFSVAASDFVITEAVAAVNAAERQLEAARRGLENAR